MANVIKHVPLIAFLAYFIKVMGTQPTLTDAAMLLIVGGIASFYEFKSNTKQIDELNTRLTAQQAFLDVASKDIEFLKSNVAGIKLTNGMRQIK